MQTTYIGIDYGHGRSNINSATGIRFGVISQNSVSPEAMDDCVFNGRDLTYEAARKEAVAEAAQAGTEFDEDSFNDTYSMADCGERDWLWEEQGYKLTNCLQSDVMVLSSPFYTHAQFCSPCVPGACNLDSPLDEPVASNKCYCLGHDWFENGRAPYPVYSVETGELVAPADA